MSESAKPRVLDRLRSRYGWFDHVMRANQRHNNCDGNFYAAGITFYTVCSARLIRHRVGSDLTRRRR